MEVIMGRSCLPLLLLLCVPADVSAEQAGDSSPRTELSSSPGTGYWILDLNAPPAFAVGYQVSDRVGLRGGFGIGQSSLSGTSFDLHTDVRFGLRPFAKLDPYVGAVVGYSHNRSVPAEPTGSAHALDTVRHTWRLGPSLGMGLRLSDRITAFTEVRLMHSTTPVYESRWWSVRLDERNQFEFGLGLTFSFR
jgi:hypothetical protein